MSKINKVSYAAIGHRLSMQIHSPTSYGFPGGKASLTLAYKTSLSDQSPSPFEFRFIPVSIENINFFEGPDIVAGYCCEESDGFNYPLLAFLYSSLDFDNELQRNELYSAYQAQVVFEESLKPKDVDLTCSILEHALTLMTLRANLHSIAHNETIPIILGIHKDPIQEFPILGKTMLEAGFKHNDNYLDEHEMHLYHKHAPWLS